MRAKLVYKYAQYLRLHISNITNVSIMMFAADPYSQSNNAILPGPDKESTEGWLVVYRFISKQARHMYHACSAAC